MKKIYLPALIVSLAACTNGSPEGQEESTADAQEMAHQEGEHHREDEEHHEEEELLLSKAAFKSLGLQMGPMPKVALQGLVMAKGQLTVPPQNRATVTSLLGANVQSIQVLEGDEVKKGTTLAYLAHPNILELQSQYAEAWHSSQLLADELARQEKLAEAKVGAGKDLISAQSQYQSALAHSQALEKQLVMLNLSPAAVRQGQLSQRAAIKAPINGFVQKVMVNTGQYAQPQLPLFEIIDIHHLHVDLMVFEQDVPKIKVGQKVRVSLRAQHGQEFRAKIFAVGKNIEEDSRALHIHAELENTSSTLVAGMYATGSIITDTTAVLALPADALVQEGNGFYAFALEGEEQAEYHFEKIKVKVGLEADGYRPILGATPTLASKKWVLNQAYYLFSEMEESEGHHH